MNESEQRRKKLLEQTRNLYNDRYAPPAVHPRYRNLYSGLYQKDGAADDEYKKSTFTVRVFICLILFASFVTADYNGSKVANIDSGRIVKEIEYQIDIKEVWKNF